VNQKELVCHIEWLTFSVVEGILLFHQRHKHGTAADMIGMVAMFIKIHI
jgi:hypothetical protein